MSNGYVVPLMFLKFDRLEPDARSLSSYRCLKNEVVGVFLQVGEEKAGLGRVEYAKDGRVSVGVEPVYAYPAR